MSQRIGARRAGVLLLSGLALGCVSADVTFELHRLERPALLSRVDRISDPTPNEEEPALAWLPQTCSYEKNIVILPLPGGFLTTQTEQHPEPEKPALALSTMTYRGEEVDFHVERVDLRHTAMWAAFYFREVNEIEIDCSAVDEEEEEADHAG